MARPDETDSFPLPIYLDNAASTPMYPAVIDRMAAIMREDYGNPSSTNHPMGRRARDLIEVARRQVATLLGASHEEIIFTSGATEGCNMAIRGVAELYSDRGNHLVVSLAEHKAVLEPCRRLERSGWAVTWLEPDRDGRLTAEQVAQAIRKDTILVALMATNNITGVLYPVAEVGRLCKSRGVLLLCDATQAAGHVPVDVHSLGADLLAISAHKMHGPKGVGALYIRAKAPRARVAPLIDGGGQERGLRSGTLNTPGIVGMGLAAEWAVADLAEESQRIASLRDRFERRLMARIPDLQVLGAAAARAPQISHILFPHIEGGALLKAVPEIMASTGAACGPAITSPLQVLQSAGHSADEANAAVRFSFGRFNSEAQVDYATDALAEAVLNHGRRL